MTGKGGELKIGIEQHGKGSRNLCKREKGESEEGRKEGRKEGREIVRKKLKGEVGTCLKKNWVSGNGSTYSS